MIEYAYRETAASSVRPGMIVQSEKGLVPVDEVTFKGADVLLIGKPLGRERGLVRLERPPTMAIRVFASDEILDEIEEALLIHGCDVKEDVVLVEASDFVWTVERRSKAKAQREAAKAARSQSVVTRQAKRAAKEAEATAQAAEQAPSPVRGTELDD